jgi:hypothetical protein
VVLAISAVIVMAWEGGGGRGSGGAEALAFWRRLKAPR